jgi:cytochrome P450
LHEEIDSVLGGRVPTSEELQKLKYTDMVFSESMRLFPPTWTMGRKALDDFHLGPYFLPTATTVLMSQWVMHRDARDFPDPLRFEPERFAPENKREHLRFSYVPFGAGLRQCIGESFARMEGALLLPRWRKAGSCDLFLATRSSPHRSLPCGQSTVSKKYSSRFGAELDVRYVPLSIFRAASAPTCGPSAKITSSIMTIVAMWTSGTGNG